MTDCCVPADQPGGTIPWHVVVYRLMLAILIGVWLLGIVGHWGRGDGVLLTVMFYIPLLPVSAMLLFIDIAKLGHALRRGRFVLGTASLATIGWVAIPMMGMQESNSVPTESSVHLVQWNVNWGAGTGNPGKHWDHMVNNIPYADIYVINEAPMEHRMDTLMSGLRQRFENQRYTGVKIEHPPASAYHYRLCVISHFDLTTASTHAIKGGTAMIVHVSIDARRPPLSILVVDSDSMTNPIRPRSPMLQDIYDLANANDVDIIAGDFNAPARSRGFESLESVYQLASRQCGSWRATWPSHLPMYDMDHVLVEPKKWVIQSCLMFGSMYSDHRGQVVTIGKRVTDRLLALTDRRP